MNIHRKNEECRKTIPMMKKFGGRNHIPYTEYRIRKVSCHIGFIFLLEPFLMDACRKLIFGQQFLLRQSIASVVRHGIFPNSFVDFYLLLVVCIVLLTLSQSLLSRHTTHMTKQVSIPRDHSQLQLLYNYSIGGKMYL